MSEPQILSSKAKGLMVAIRLMMLIGVIAVLFVLVQSCSRPKNNLMRFAEGSLKKLEVLDVPPAQPSLDFVDINGHSVNLRDFRGQYVLLNIWATWCAPCTAELPSLDKLQGERGSDDFVVIAISMDRARIDADKFYQRTNISHLKLYHDPSLRISAKVGVDGLPISILYDITGAEILRIPGEVDWQSSEVEVLLSQFIQ